ncbi:tyrosine-type recombinase/integrase [Brevibacterium sp. PAMC23299]|nr:tyrosine-type recombinase/integrase [Brevibacterium sp. PAMC23299]
MFLLLDTGMRISEAVGLRIEDIVLKTNVIELKSATTKNRKKDMFRLLKKQIRYI